MKTKEPKNELRQRYEQKLQQLDDSATDDDRIRAVVSDLKAAYIEHKHDFLVTTRHRQFKEMIKTALAESAQVDRQSIERRARQRCPQYVDQSPGAAGDGRKLGSIADDFRQNATKLAKKTEIEAMKREDLESALEETEARVNSLQRDYRSVLRLLKRLATDYEAARQLFWFPQRHSAYKNAIKLALRELPEKPQRSAGRLTDT